MDILIRPESAQDAAAIHRVTAAAFEHAPHTSHTEQFIVDALRDAGQLAVSLVAEHRGRVVGHVALSPVTISDGTAQWLGLGPVSVLPELQRQGIGTRLVQRALELARRLGASGCVVLGDPVYYGRFGFKAEPALTLPGVPPEYFQALALRDAMPSGIVAYHESFSAQG